MPSVEYRRPFIFKIDVVAVNSAIWKDNYSLFFSGPTPVKEVFWNDWHINDKQKITINKGTRIVIKRIISVNTIDSSGSSFAELEIGENKFIAYASWPKFKEIIE